MSLNPTVKKNSIHIVIIALFQLLVFVTPQVIKSTHHHHTETQFAVPVKDNSISITHEQCPLCHFEFVTFIKADKEKQPIYKKLLYTVTTSCTSDVINTFFNCFSNRAPPLFTV
jgi:hypothetical protein